jgi:hypothetical protein
MSKWRIAGKVKQARKRAQKRADIRAGRILSMQEYVRRTHQHNHQEEEQLPVVLEQERIDPKATHVLVRRTTSLVDGSPVEAEIFRGTESQMRTKRKQMMDLGTADTYSVRKIKVAA